MNKIKLPDFVTFQNFNETLDLIRGKQLEIKALYGFGRFQKFIDIFRVNPNLNLLRLEIFVDKYKNNICLTKVDFIDINGEVFNPHESTIMSISFLVGHSDNYLLEGGPLVIGRDDLYSNDKLKSFFNIKNISNVEIDAMNNKDMSLIENDIRVNLDKMYSLKKQVLVMGILMLFKKDNNLKKIKLVVDNAISGSKTAVLLEFVFFDKVKCAVEDCKREVLKEIGDLVGTKIIYNIDDFYSFEPFELEVNRNNLDDIRNLSKCIMRPNKSEDFGITLEKEILEIRISQHVTGGKHLKMRI